MCSNLKLAFVTGLSDKKLNQKLLPLQALAEVEQIDIYRRLPYSGHKIRWMGMPRLFSKIAILGDMWRFLILMKNAKKYDVIIGCHQRFHGVYAAIAGYFFQIKVIQLVITDLVWINKIFLAGWALKKADAVGFRGQKSIQYFKNQYGNMKICFIPHNIWQPRNTNSISVLENKSIDLLYVGYLADYKNIPDWLKTAERVKAMKGQLKAVMVGEQPDKKLVHMIKKLGLSDDIEFPGPVYGEKLAQYYEKSKVFLLTSFYEGLPMVALEAMNAGLPVVATDVGDTADLVKDNENGYLIKVGEIEKAARLIFMLLNDKDVYQKISKNAYLAAGCFLEKCKLETVSNEWHMVFEKMGLLNDLMKQVI